MTVPSFLFFRVKRGVGVNVRDMFCFYAIMSCKSFVRNQII